MLCQLQLKEVHKLVKSGSKKFVIFLYFLKSSVPISKDLDNLSKKWYNVSNLTIGTFDIKVRKEVFHNGRTV